MNLLDLGLLYLLIGAGCATIAWRRAEDPAPSRAISSGLVLLLWPLFGPLMLLPDAPPRSAGADRVREVEAELARAVDAAKDTPFRMLLTPDAAERLQRELHAAARRVAELDQILAQPGFDLDAAEARVDALASREASARAVRTAVMHRENVARIVGLRDRHLRTLDELAELAGALRSQLVLARYAGSSPTGVGGIVTELWARVESLGEILDEQSADEDEAEAARAEVDRDRAGPLDAQA